MPIRENENNNVSKLVQVFKLLKFSTGILEGINQACKEFKNLPEEIHKHWDNNVVSVKERALRYDTVLLNDVIKYAENYISSNNLQSNSSVSSPSSSSIHSRSTLDTRNGINHHTENNFPRYNKSRFLKTEPQRNVSAKVDTRWSGSAFLTSPKKPRNFIAENIDKVCNSYRKS